MIEFGRLRSVRLALAVVLLLGGLAASGPPEFEMVSCAFVGSSMSCGDPEFEARLKAQMLTPDQARAFGL
ncbi:hypothetical protein [Acrocarpospora sp. B8E8]|uniref:hypothetical protein n=1 Tax=Acrocarpospora sp. B8E8 TaxID=3153572 RepID=UPI00325F04B1